MQFNKFLALMFFLIILVLASGCIGSLSSNTGSSDPKNEVEIINSSYSCDNAAYMRIDGFAKNNNNVGMDVILLGEAYDSAGTKLGQPGYAKITMGPGVVKHFEISSPNCNPFENNISYKISVYDATVYQ